MDHPNFSPRLASPSQLYRVEKDPNVGRFMVSNAPLRAGDLIAEGKPYAIVVFPPYKKICCNTCLKVWMPSSSQRNRIIGKIDSNLTTAMSLADGLNMTNLQRQTYSEETNTLVRSKQENEFSPMCCPLCKDIWYCSSYCAEQASPETMHRLSECRALRRLYSSSKFNSNEIAEMKLMIRIIARRFEEITTNPNRSEISLLETLTPSFDPTVTFKDVEDLVSNQEAFDKKSLEKYQVMVQCTRMALQSRILQGLTDENIEELFCKVACNVFGIWNKRLRSTKALAIYPNCSFFNHSCVPNCVRFQNGPLLQIRTLYAIPENTELTISYIELEDDVTSRKRILQQFYHFECRCYRCISNDSDESFRRISPYMCQVKGCSGLLGNLEPLDVGLSDKCYRAICSGGCGFRKEMEIAPIEQTQANDSLQEIEKISI